MRPSMPKEPWELKEKIQPSLEREGEDQGSLHGVDGVWNES